MASSTLGNIFNVSDSEAEARPNSEIETEKQSSQGYEHASTASTTSKIQPQQQ